MSGLQTCMTKRTRTFDARLHTRMVKARARRQQSGFALVVDFHGRMRVQTDMLECRRLDIATMIQHALELAHLPVPHKASQVSGASGRADHADCARERRFAIGLEQRGLVHRLLLKSTRRVKHETNTLRTKTRPHSRD